MSRIGYVIEGQNIPDEQKLFHHIQKLHPRWLKVLNSPQFAAKIQAISPVTNIVLRRVGEDAPDETIWQRLKPKEWIEYRKDELKYGDFWLYTTNEPGNSTELLEWHIELLDLAKDLKLVVCNFSVGTPNVGDYTNPTMIRLFKALDQYRHRAILGLHEYFGAVATSGMIGGSPDMHDYVDAANWPKREALKDKILWHCGRFQFIEKACATYGLQPPRILITEHGHDYTPDIAAWLDRLDHGKPRGWMTLEAQWRQWFPQWTHQEAYFEMIKYLDMNVYQGSPVEGQLLFIWNGTKQWDTYKLENADMLHTLLEQYASNFEVIQPKPIETLPHPADKGEPEKFVVPVSGQRSLRRTPMMMTNNVICEVAPAETVNVYRRTMVYADGMHWYWVERSDNIPEVFRYGWMSLILPTFQHRGRKLVIYLPSDITNEDVIALSKSLQAWIAATTALVTKLQSINIDLSAELY